jgi:hypothetical protein
MALSACPEEIGPHRPDISEKLNKDLLPDNADEADPGH